MNKKIFASIGIIVSLVMVLCGILVFTGAFGGNTSTASGASYSYDSGYATFGADFYTYVSNNAEEAAVAGRVTARNLDSIATLIKVVSGVFLLCFGLLSACYFGMALCDAGKDGQFEFTLPVKKPAAPAADPAAAPAEESAPVEDKDQRLAKLNELFAQGILTEEEYEAKRLEILGQP